MRKRFFFFLDSHIASSNAKLDEAVRMRDEAIKILDECKTELVSQKLKHEELILSAKQRGDQFVALKNIELSNDAIDKMNAAKIKAAKERVKGVERLHLSMIELATSYVKDSMKASSLASRKRSANDSHSSDKEDLCDISNDIKDLSSILSETVGKYN